MSTPFVASVCGSARHVDWFGMAQGPDLFVVCKNCRAEVSPYITECPYCGHRLRKRAPKLDKGGVPKPPKQRRRPPKPSLGRLRPGEMPGLRADGKPYATLALVVGAAVFTILVKADIVSVLDVTVLFGTQDGWYRTLGTSFFYGSTGYELAALFTIFLFGWLLERRHGHWAPLVVYAVATAAGIGATLALEDLPQIIGGNAGALGMVGAWAMRDLLAMRRNEDTDADMLGVIVIVVVLVLMPAAVQEANPITGAVGGLTGLLLGLGLARLPER